MRDRASSPVAEFRGSAFRTQPFVILLGAGQVTRQFPFPVLTARDWLGFFGSSSWIVHTVSALPSDFHELFIDQVERGELGAADVTAFAHSALAQSAGRPWWEAERLIGACFGDAGRLLGTVLTGGVDPSRMTLAVFLACVWATLTKGLDATGLAKLEGELLVPPPEATPEERGELDGDDVNAVVERLRAMPGVRTG